MRVTFGSEWLEVNVPGEMVMVAPPLNVPTSSPETIIRSALTTPVEGKPLADLAKAAYSALILIACRTRRTGSEVFIPEMVSVLNEAGIADSSITVCTATGTHDNFRAEDAELLAGADCARRLNFVGHDCRTPEKLAEVGTTTRGTRLRLARRYLDSPLRITTGRVTYHYFAGFSAGRKGVLPGVAAIDSILSNHALAVSKEDGQVGLNPHACNGNLATNPVHLDMLEAARMAPPHFTLATVLNTSDQLVSAYGGEMEAAHVAGVAKVRASDRVEVEAPFDWLIVSCGGAHCDVNAIQAIKALLNNYRAVRPGGAIIFVAECPGGSPDWLLQACALRGEGELEAKILKGEVRQAHNPLWIRHAREHAHVIMVTKLSPAAVDAFGFHHASNISEAVQMAEKHAGLPRRTAVVPFGNITVLEMKEA